MNFDSADAGLHTLDAASRNSNTHQYAFANGIERTRALLNRLGGAPVSTRHCAIVTGSKGKGSTVMMLAHLLAACGLRVGAFTGPHLHKTTERFAVLQRGADGTVRRDEMDDATFISLADAVLRAAGAVSSLGGGSPTRFEAFTAMAYRWFEQSHCDFSIIEVGIGGRHDATNLAEPAMSVFANISLEHTQILGGTLSEIAGEKAGIMRPGAPAIIASQPPEALITLQAEAARLGAPVHLADEHWQVRSVRHQLETARVGQWLAVARAGGQGRETQVFLPLAGLVQAQNLATALTALDALGGLGYDTSAATALMGLATLHWPGRFEVLGTQPLLIVDGAHTPHAIHELFHSLTVLLPNRPLHVVFGALRDKDVPAMLSRLMMDAASLHFAAVRNKRAVPGAQLSEWAAQLRAAQGEPIPTNLHQGSEDALMSAFHSAMVDNGVLVVCGSLHLVAEAQLWANRRKDVTPIRV